MQTDLESDPAVAAPERQPVFGRVFYDEELDYMLAWAARIIPLFAAAAAWIWVGTWSGIAAAVGCVVIWVAVGYVQHWAFRLLAIVLAVVVPLGLVIGPQIGVNNRMAQQAAEARAAAEKPYTDAVSAAKANLQQQGFTVDKLSLNRSDLTQGYAYLVYNHGRTSYPKVILIKKGGRWTVNCPTASGPVDVAANGYELGELMYVAGECPAGFVPSTQPTP